MNIHISESCSPHEKGDHLSYSEHKFVKQESNSVIDKISDCKIMILLKSIHKYKWNGMSRNNSRMKD